MNTKLSKIAIPLLVLITMFAMFGSAMKLYGQAFYKPVLFVGIFALVVLIITVISTKAFTKN